MTRRRKQEDKQFVSNGITKLSQRKKPINSDFLVDLQPITEKQKKLFESYSDGKNIIAHGCAGTGKTLILFYNALKEVLDLQTPYEIIYLFRSSVATRSIGYLPGDLGEKIGVYELPYKKIVKHIFQMNSSIDYDMLYDCLKAQKTIEFCSNSFIRGVTLDNCIILVDEFSNMNFHELDSMITRVGENCKIMFSGDATQSDLIKTEERQGIIDFMKIIKAMPSFDIIEFELDDVVRSSIVKDYLTAKHQLGM